MEYEYLQNDPRLEREDVALRSIQPVLPVSDAWAWLPEELQRTSPDYVPQEIQDLYNKNTWESTPQKTFNLLKSRRLYVPPDLVQSLHKNLLIAERDEKGKLTGRYYYNPDVPLWAQEADTKTGDSKYYEITEDNVDKVLDPGTLQYSLAEPVLNWKTGKYDYVNPFTYDSIYGDYYGARLEHSIELPKSKVGMEFNNPNGIQVGNYKILPEQYENLRAHQMDASLKEAYKKYGINDDMLRQVGVQNGFDGLTLDSIRTIKNNIDTSGLSLSAKRAFDNANADFFGINRIKHTPGEAVDIQNPVINRRNKFYGPIKYANKYRDVRTGEEKYMADGGDINTTSTFRLKEDNSFANGGRMSRKSSEATRGNARLVRKREEDDDDAYFQDTPRGGSDIDTLAVRVMRGEMGTGEQLRRNLGTKYQAVQRRVKQLRASQGGMMEDDVDEFSDDELSENAFANGGRLSRITRPNDKRYEIYF